MTIDDAGPMSPLAALVDRISVAQDAYSASRVANGPAESFRRAVERVLAPSIARRVLDDLSGVRGAMFGGRPGTEVRMLLIERFERTYQTRTAYQGRLRQSPQVDIVDAAVAFATDQMLAGMHTEAVANNLPDVAHGYVRDVASQIRRRADVALTEAERRVRLERAVEAVDRLARRAAIQSHVPQQATRARWAAAIVAELRA